MTAESELPFLGFEINWDALQQLQHAADGGMCRVYRALLQGHDLAIKVPLRDTEKYTTAVKDLEHELQVLQLLQHPHIVHLYGAGRTPEGDMFLALEHLPGG